MPRRYVLQMMPVLSSMVATGRNYQARAALDGRNRLCDVTLNGAQVFDKEAKFTVYRIDSK